MQEVPILACSQEKDLGVLIDDCLTFTSHIHNAINKAQSVLGAMRRSFTFLDKQMFLILYKSLVRPHLEYANAVWAPHHQKYINLLERVQRRATRMVPSLKDLPYADRLKQLKLPSLCYRRRRGDMIQLYKIIHGLDRLDPSIFFERSSYSVTRGHNFKLSKKHCRLDIRKYCFSQRTVNYWNALPSCVVNSESVNQFKTRSTLVS